LKRAIQREIETPLARLLLKGDIRDGQKVLVDLGVDGTLKFKPPSPRELIISHRGHRGHREIKKAMMQSISL